jgi:hypothetical protein
MSNLKAMMGDTAKKAPAKKTPPKKTPTKKAVQAPEVAQESDSSPSKGKGRTKPMSIYVTPEMWKALNFQKIDEGRSVNDIINDALSAYLETVGGPELKK